MQGLRVIVIGGGHAGVEAAWAAAGVLGGTGSVALVTLDPGKVGEMSCNPAIGGLAKGQLVREVDALGGVMGLAADASGIQFKVLNTSKGAAVHGPRAQCDKHAYARAVRALMGARPEIVTIPGAVEELLVEPARCAEGRRIVGVRVLHQGRSVDLLAPAVVLTTGTFMRGLMHTGEARTPGGRYGEAPATGISAALTGLGFELGRLKTGTPPRLARDTIDWDALDPYGGDAVAVPFSELSTAHDGAEGNDVCARAQQLAGACAAPSLARFPVLAQVDCRLTQTGPAVHALIRANLHRAPMYSGQIESAGPRYCPSVEDKVVRFADKASHPVILEPESHESDWVYCNGLSTSLPADVQEQVVRLLPGCARARVYRHGYAVEYDIVRPHQLRVTGESKPVAGLFLAGQINGTSGYEEAAAQGVVAGLNAARRARDQEAMTIGRDLGYIGVLMDDLVTKTPTEPYRMFTSRAEHRLTLRADNAPERLTARAQQWGLLDHGSLGALRAQVHAARMSRLACARAAIDPQAGVRVDGRPLAEALRRPEFSVTDLRAALAAAADRSAPAREAARLDNATLERARIDAFYEPYARKGRAQAARMTELERRSIPATLDYARLPSLRTEARQALARFRPATLGQASRLEGLTPADVTLLAVLIKKERERTS